MNLEDYPKAQSSGQLVERHTSPLKAMTERRNRLQQALLDLNSAIEALEANPEVARILELISKVGRL